MNLENRILLKNMDVDSDSEQGRLIHNLRFSRIIKMLRKRLPDDSRFSLKNLIDIVLEDPTTHIREDQLIPGKYCEWLVKQFLQAEVKSIFWEDLKRTASDLARFHDLKTRGKIPLEKRDILNIVNANDLFDILSEKENQIVLDGFPDYRHLIRNADAVLIHASETRNVYALLSYKGSREIGSNTRWCTVASHGHFSSYSTKSFLYVIFEKKKDRVEKYQIHFSTDQYANVDDRMVNVDHLFISEVKRDMIAFAKQENDPFALLYFGEFDLITEKQFDKIFSTLGMGYGKNGIRQRLQEFLSGSRGQKMLHSLPQSTIKSIFRTNCSLIEKIENPTREMKVAAIIVNGGYIVRFPEIAKDEETLKHIIRANTSVVSYIHKPSKDIQNLVIHLGGIRYLRNLLPEMRLEAIKKDWRNIQYLKNQTQEEANLAFEKNVLAVQFIEYPTEKMQIAAVKKSPSLIRYICVPCHAAQMIAVEAEHTLISHINRPSEQVRKRAEILKNEELKRLRNDPPVVKDKNRWSDLPITERIAVRDKQRQNRGY